MTNRNYVVLDYMYRDASNYKQFGVIAFAGSLREGDRDRVERCLEDRERFVADQVRVPEVFFYDPWGELAGSYAPDPEDDHCWHELDGLRETREASLFEEMFDTHGRTWDQFLEEVEAVSRGGWRLFEPEELHEKPPAPAPVYA